MHWVLGPCWEAHHHWNSHLASWEHWQHQHLGWHSGWQLEVVPGQSIYYATNEIERLANLAIRSNGDWIANLLAHHLPLLQHFQVEHDHHPLALVIVKNEQCLRR